MRMMNERTNESIDNLTLLLKKEEAIQLIGYLESLVSNDIMADHCHLNDSDYKKEITIALYDDYSTKIFTERIKELIVHDK